ncbi:glutamine--fructose-6-phosphate transaminase (isomerizing) [Euzebya tangerina]|uniref:glutamine--fructose-6-phosphate transaminase (isomerizing) n=1 Tax=Euzebya tangerina TaxID=591198 RepID=UPI000E30EB8A|nr:glutamine--fructose-6-phosphate transaminase (isomerizing) [Euzebya tangerina]
MCGIMGYTGRDDCLGTIVNGLARLEYRGYDSAGVAVISPDAEITIHKKAGKLANLRDTLPEGGVAGTCGIGHTRWATHGVPNDVNAHPHLDPTGTLAVIHNGIIENYEQIKSELRERRGAVFTSDTDTEVIAHLVAALYEGSLPAAVRAATKRFEGQFAFAVVDIRQPDVIVAAKRSAPMILGHLEDGSMLSSDVAGLIEHTREVEALLDDQIAILTPEGITVTDLDGAASEGHRYTVDWDVEAAEKQGYDTFMLKEIHEQPQAVSDTLLGRVDADGRIVLDQLDFDPALLRATDKIYVVACGTSYHAGMVSKYAIEHWARIGVEVEFASEFRYRDPILTRSTLVVAISQSGETADTIAAAEYAKAQGARVVAVTNIVGSTLARTADATVYTRAGLEVAVASTKAFTTQIIALSVLALFLAQERREMFAEECRDMLDRMEALPALMHQVLEQEEHIAELARRWADAQYVMFIGRQVGLPLALEGALKLKEISYIHAEGFASGEMKHGPIALIDEGGPVIALATEGHVKSKVVSNIQEVRARGAQVLLVATEGDTEVKAHADHVIYVPDVHELLYPVLTVLPLQLIGYHMAVELGRDVDQPRNLAKTVTVE